MDETLNQPLPQESNTPVQTQHTDTNPAASPNAELDQNMRLALNGYQEFSEQPNHPQSPQEASPAAVAAEPNSEPVGTTFDINGYWKNNFGFDNEEIAKQEISKLRQTAAPQPIKYENEDSRKLHEAIAAGKRDEVLSILNQQAQLERLSSLDVNKETASDIVKTAMQLKYKDLTKDEINYKFNKQFSLPPEPSHVELESEDEYNQRIAAWQEQVNDRTMELMIEAKLAKPELANAKTKIELPAIQTPIDENYVQWKKEQEEINHLDDVTKEAYKNFTSKTIETKIPFIDEANKINFEFQYEPDGESFKQTFDVLSDIEKFFNAFKNSDGSPNREEFARALHMALNYKKIIPEAIKQGGNARMKSQLPNNNGNGNGVVRRLEPQPQQANELHEQMRMAGVVK